MEAAESHPDWTREVAALRRVAGALLHDEHATDDALQDAWLRAHTRAVGHPDQPSTFWKRVVANLARDRRRGDARRSERERQAARPEALPSTDEVAMRLELVQRVARAAAELAEPYRSTIHLHYFENLSAPEIAARAGVPLETVRTRIRRGLAQMRTQLDESSGGDRRAWSLALAPLALRDAPALSTATAAVAAHVTTTGGLLAVSKTPLLVAGLLATVAFLWVSLPAGDPAGSEDAHLPTRGVATGAPEQSPLSSGLAVSAPSPGTRTALSVGAAAVDAGPPSLGLDLVGTLVLIDEQGREHDDRSGRFKLVRSAGASKGASNWIQVEAGRWSAHVSRAERLAFKDFWIDEHPAQSISAPTDVPPDGSVRVVAQAWPRCMLRVVDAGTGAQLDGVELRWSLVGYMGLVTVHPGDELLGTVQHTGLRSPLPFACTEVLREDIPVRAWVRAPGYAWAYCDLLPAAGGAHTVGLSPAGTLAVYPDGPRPAAPWILRLQAPESNGADSPYTALAVQRPAEGACTRIENLTPGRYRVEAVLEFAPSVILASTEVEVRAGELASATLMLTAAPSAPPTTHLTGTLGLPEGTTTNVLFLYALPGPDGQPSSQLPVRLPTADMQPHSTRPGTLTWDAGEVACGEYVTLIYGPFPRVVFHAGPERESHLAIELEQPVDVTVLVLDRRTGREIPLASVSWSSMDSADGFMQMWRSTSDETQQGFIQFAAPPGPVSLTVEASGWKTDHRVVHLAAGEACELRVELARETGFVAASFEGSTQLPLYPGTPQVFDRTGAAITEPELRRDASTVTALLEPGIYRLKFTEPPEGWHAPEWIEVEVAAGDLTPVRVALERD